MQTKPDDIASPRTRYKVLKPLGGSLLGRTVLAEDRSNGRRVVLKELEMRDAEDWKEIELFERGAQTLKSLDHPQIPAFYDSFYDEDAARFYLAQEYIEGLNLKQKLDEAGALDEASVREFLSSMLGILEYLHGFSPPVIHRDIKPSNIMLRPDGSYALIDFDVVQTVLPDQVGGSTVVGTTGYMPPEQLVGQARPASDLYSLGVTAVQLATGVDPTSLPMRRGVLDFQAHSPLSGELNHLLKRMIAARLDQRLDTAQAARRALDELEEDAGSITLRELKPSQLRAIQAHCSPAARGDWGEVELAGNTLRITFFSRPHQSVLQYIVGAMETAAAASLLATLAIIDSATLFSEIFEHLQLFLLIFVGLTIIFWIFAHFIKGLKIIETGVQQTLTLSPGEIRLKETKKFKYWGGRRRALNNWVIPQRELERVYHRDISAGARSPSGPLQREAAFAQLRESPGLVFVDRFGNERIAGEDLHRGSDKPDFHARMELLSSAEEAADTYINALRAHDEHAPLAASTPAAVEETKEVEEVALIDVPDTVNIESS